MNQDFIEGQTDLELVEGSPKREEISHIAGPLRYGMAILMFFSFPYLSSKVISPNSLSPSKIAIISLERSKENTLFPIDISPS